MIAEKDEALYEAAKALFYDSSEEEIRQRCLDREEYYQDLRNYEQAIEERNQAIIERDQVIEELRAELAKLRQ